MNITVKEDEKDWMRKKSRKDDMIIEKNTTKYPTPKG
ncbi:MAG: hypothetical protein HW390_1609 [Candidatus Brocadiaceae bacterium]|nr:hypothetical protein [Candidatus Brocadiaceae bacterium]